jgi:hypothetical protein
LMLVCAVATQSSARTFFDLWYGEGYATHNNYDLATSYGLNFYKAVSYGVGFGFTTFVQQVNLNYNTESDNASGGSIRVNSKYYVFAPMVVAQLGHSGHFSGYLNGGVGVLSDGWADVHTWSNTPWPAGSSYNYDIQSKSYLSSLVFRFGLGFIQYAHMFGSFHLFVNEDFGIFPASLQNTGYTDNNIVNFKQPLNSFFSPTYVSLRLGIAHITNSNPKRKR